MLFISILYFIRFVNTIILKYCQSSIVTNKLTADFRIRYSTTNQSNYLTKSESAIVGSRLNIV